MSKKLIIIMLTVWTVLFFAGCRTIASRTACDCDCDCCDCGYGSDKDDRYDGPGEYEGWRD